MTTTTKALGELAIRSPEILADQIKATNEGRKLAEYALAKLQAAFVMMTRDLERETLEYLDRVNGVA